MADEFWSLLLMFGPPLIAVAALIGAIASGVALSKAPRGQRVGPAIVLGLCTVVALGIGVCYGLVFTAIGS